MFGEAEDADAGQRPGADAVQPQDDWLTVRSVSKAVVSAVAPDELPELGRFLDVYEGNPSVVRTAERRRSVPVGFGGGSGDLAQVVVGTVAWLLGALQAGATQAVQDRARHRASRALDVLGRVFRHQKPAVPDRMRPVPLSADQVGAIRQAALDQLRRGRMRQHKAELFADAIVGAVTVKPAEGPGSE